MTATRYLLSAESSDDEPTQFSDALSPLWGLFSAPSSVIAAAAASSILAWLCLVALAYSSKYSLA